MYLNVSGKKTFFSNGNGQLDSAQPSIVFLHGAGMDHSIWVMPARFFARHQRNVYAFDLPGHGRSEGSALGAIDDLADWVGSALQAAAVPKAALVGHSMGSLVALNFAARHPGMTAAIALLGTSVPMPVTPPLLNAAKANEQDAIDMTNIWSHSSFGQTGGNENPGISMTMSGQRLLESAGQDVLFTDLNACNEFANGEALAAQVKAPALVIAGNQDKMTSPVKALEVASRIKGSQQVRLEPCGHAMLSEQPNAVLDALASFLLPLE